MDTSFLAIAILVLVAVVLTFVVVAVLRYQRRRSAELEDRFGPEYERAIGDADSRRAAEADLVQREKRRQTLDIRDLSEEERQHYRQEWQSLQNRFVDQPEEAVRDADRLVLQAMRDRGYPMDAFEQRAADLSVDHPTVVENYRAAHAIAVEHEKGEADTERLRQAVVYYRDLFDALLGGESDRRTEHDHV
jgi:hypothetical protein